MSLNLLAKFATISIDDLYYSGGPYSTLPSYTYSVPEVASAAPSAFAILLFFLLGLAVIVFAVLTVIGRWKIFTKAGHEGWKSLIPIYSDYAMFQILSMEPLLCILYQLPVSHLALRIVSRVKLAKSFKRGIGFAIGLILLPGIFEMILGFGPAKYHALPSSK